MNGDRNVIPAKGKCYVSAEFIFSLIFISCVAGIYRMLFSLTICLVLFNFKIITKPNDDDFCSFNISTKNISSSSYSLCRDAFNTRHIKYILFDWNMEVLFYLILDVTLDIINSNPELTIVLHHAVISSDISDIKK